MKVLVTGGAGFIGSHLCETLSNLGMEVTSLDNLSTGTLENVNQLSSIKFLTGDITNKVLVDELVQISDLVFHLAAAVGVRTILTKPIESIQTNFLGSEIVLSACSKYDRRLVIASTSEIYGKNSKQPLKESDDRVMGSPQKLRWSYADSKALEEALAYALFLSKGLRVTTTRFFNVVGPKQSSAYGMVLPNFIESAMSGNPIRVFGDGKQTRVFCHVKDVVSALIKLLDDDRTIGEVFNIGGKGEINILDLAKLIIEKTNSNSTITYTDYTDAYAVGYEDMSRRVPDISKIKSYSGWEPIIGLGEIISDVANIFSKEI